MADNNNSIHCPVEAALEVVGGKWKGRIIFKLQADTLRFNELRRAIPEITQRMLTKQLRDLEANGVVHRQVFAEVPPRVEYSLTEFGQTLTPILKELNRWGVSYINKLNAIRESAE